MVGASQYQDFALNEIQLSSVFNIERRILTFLMNISGRFAHGVGEEVQRIFEKVLCFSKMVKLMS